MKRKEQWATEDIKRLAKEIGIIATDKAWLAGFDFAKQIMVGFDGDIHDVLVIGEDEIKHEPGSLE